MSLAKRPLACFLLAFVCNGVEVDASPIFFDPVGDRLTMAPGPYPDILSIETMLNIDVISFVVTFADMILPAPPSLPIPPNSINLIIDLDLDQNPSTGFEDAASRLTEFFGYPPVNLGSDLKIQIGSSVVPQSVFGLDPASNLRLFELPNAAIYQLNSVSFSLPLALLNDDGRLNYSVFVFGGVAIPSDRAPNGTTPFSTVPASESTLLLLGIGLAALTGIRGGRPTGVVWLRKRD